MSCAYPIKIKNKYYGLHNDKFKSYTKIPYFYVPCGKCLSCAISKRTWLNTACNYELNKYGCGSFTTLTYDDEHYLHLWDKEIQDFRGDYRDFQLFIKRLRINLYRKYNFNYDFKYLAVGEYGGKNGRFHIHVLFFGLDYKSNDMEIWNAWEQGIADNRPIKEGGINYVLKYKDKDEMRKRNDIVYNFKKEQKPFEYHSLGLGKGFIEEHLEDIILNNGTYDRGDGKRHSLPPYWCNKLCIKPLIDLNEVRKQMIQEGYKGYRGIITDNDYISKSECTNWLIEKARLKEERLIRECRDDGKPQDDFDKLTWEIKKNEMI